MDRKEGATKRRVTTFTSWPEDLTAQWLFSVLMSVIVMLYFQLWSDQCLSWSSRVYLNSQWHEHTSTIFGDRLISCLVGPVAQTVTVCVSVSVSDCIMVPAFVDAANERVCPRLCSLLHSGYREAPITEHHGNRKWAGHLVHQWWGISLASWHSGCLFDVTIGCLASSSSSPQHHTWICSHREVVVICLWWGIT